MITVKLLPGNRVSPIVAASFGALSCYMSKFPKWGKIIDTFNKLFKTGHHTTFMSAPSYFTFQIEGISVGDITFGLHLSSPFYNSSQRSGRYCSAMFIKFVKRIKAKLREYLVKVFPAYRPEEFEEVVEEFNPEKKLEEIKSYIKEFWPEVRGGKLNLVMDYVQFGISVFQANIEAATIKAVELAKKERPFVRAESLEANAPRFAQEQLRMFIPVITSTGIVYTVNLISLIALWESSHTPAMRYTTGEMVRQVLEKFPKLSPMFNEGNRRKDDWAMMISARVERISTEPRAELLSIDEEDNFVLPNPFHRHPVDKLHYVPELMDNSVGDIKSSVVLSVATMGQDQRHRTLRRGKPEFTSEFYLPPIPNELGLKDKALGMLLKWQALYSEIPASLAMILAPYGAMVSYKKRGSFLAIDHEQGKRTCWCAQEEIYWAGVQLRKGIEKKLGSSHPLLQIFEPPCYRTGHCAEGDRYCGRDLKLRGKKNYFPRRNV